MRILYDAPTKDRELYVDVFGPSTKSAAFRFLVALMGRTVALLRPSDGVPLDDFAPEQRADGWYVIGKPVTA